MREEDKKSPQPDPSAEVMLALSNLERVDCLRLGMTWGGGGSFRRINPTLLGKEFVAACRVNQI